MKFVREMIEEFGKGYMISLTSLLLVGLLAWIGFSHMEARTYSKLTGVNVLTLDAMFVQLRVIEPAKTDPTIVQDEDGYLWILDEKNQIFNPMNERAEMFYKIKRSEEEINEVLNQAALGIDSGSKFPGMSFEEGVQQFADWLFGQVEDSPFED